MQQDSGNSYFHIIPNPRKAKATSAKAPMMIIIISMISFQLVFWTISYIQNIISFIKSHSLLAV